MSGWFGFKATLFLSLGLAIASMVAPLLILAIGFRASSDMVWAFQAEAAFVAAWIVVVALGLMRYRARGLWMLLGAPFILWPVLSGFALFK